MGISLEKLKELRNYYKNIEDELTIIGLNDSQGVNSTVAFWKRSLLDYIKLAHSDEELRPILIDAFSLTMNKTEHIDEFLYANLSLEEIKWSQIYSAISDLEKIMADNHLPKSFGKVGYAYKYIYKPQEEDRTIKISDSIRNSNQPIVIYSSGVNNIMREVGNNPFKIQKDYVRRFNSPNFYYTLKKARRPETLTKIIDNIDRNFYNILSLNDNAELYVLGSYVSKSLSNDKMKIFRDLSSKYNENLLLLCKDYGATFINMEDAGKKYNNNKINFHINSAGHNAVANHILEKMYERNIENQKCDIKVELSKNNIYSNYGIEDILNSITMEISECEKSLKKSHGYDRKRKLQIINEHKREHEIFEKVLKKC